MYLPIADIVDTAKAGHQVCAFCRKKFNIMIRSCIPDVKPTVIAIKIRTYSRKEDALVYGDTFAAIGGR
jgi:hypothetical protein